MNRAEKVNNREVGQHRPKIDYSRWAVLTSAADRLGVSVSDVLRNLVDRFAAGRKRGPGRHAEQYRAVEELLRHVTLDSIRYEAALSEFLGRAPADRSLAEAEIEDHADAVVRVVLKANGDLQRRLIELQDRLTRERRRSC